MPRVITSFFLHGELTRNKSATETEKALGGLLALQQEKDHMSEKKIN